MLVLGNVNDAPPVRSSTGFAFREWAPAARAGHRPESWATRLTPAGRSGALLRRRGIAFGCGAKAAGLTYAARAGSSSSAEGGRSGCCLKRCDELRALPG